jgi:hypothetical protein
VDALNGDKLLCLAQDLGREDGDRGRACVISVSPCGQLWLCSLARGNHAPSPTSSSWTFEMLTKIFAAGLSSAMDLRMVAPSLVTVISPVDVEWRILFMPLGPRVDLTRSPRARAPTNDERRAWREGVEG